MFACGTSTTSRPSFNHDAEVSARDHVQIAGGDPKMMAEGAPTNVELGAQIM